MSGYAMAPAYTSVQSAHIITQPPSAHAEQHKKVEWPPSVKEYVRRSFEPTREVKGVSRGDMERKLKEVITSAAESGQLLMIDWAKYPLPQEIVQQEQIRRSQAYLYQSTYPNSSPNQLQNENSPPNGKKRKMEDLTVTNSDSNPPWRQSVATSPSGFGDRITYANKGQANRMEKRLKKAQMTTDGISSKFQEDLDKRRRRFEQDKPAKVTHHHSFDPDDEQNVRVLGPVVGTCEDLEKSYFRLTRQPRPHEVRPQQVLEKTLDHLKKKWRTEANYVYICDQFKSMRQDLYVQHIKNSLTVDVYELHARIALEKGDLGEYNQCQTQLRALYSLNLGGHPSEFLAYRILYFIHTANRTGMNGLLAELTPADREKEAVKHALNTRSALASGNYHRLFKLYLDVPNMGAYLMDMFIVRERLLGLSKLCNA